MNFKDIIETIRRLTALDIAKYGIAMIIFFGIILGFALLLSTTVGPAIMISFVIAYLIWDKYENN